MNINIISNDARYEILNDFLNENGYYSKITTLDNLTQCDAVILPMKTNASVDDFKHPLSKVGNAIVFTGERDKISQVFNGEIVDYSKNESFLLENAYITAECALSIALSELNKTLSQTRALIIGYGRIGKYLSKMLLDLNTSLYVYARREESVKEATLSGAQPFSISELDKGNFDVVFNTVPERIVPKAISDKIKDTLLIELASAPGGFEDDGAPKKALKLPGIMKPRSAGYAIYNFVSSYLSSIKEG